MKVCYITTINSLKEISGKSDYLFCLAPFVEKENTYAEFFRNESRKGKFIIVDDSIAENGGVLSSWELIQKAIEVKASEIVIPDVLGDYRKTRIKRNDFLKENYQDLKYRKIRTMSVIQGSNLKEYEKCLQEIEDDDRIDTIGIPFRIEFHKFNEISKEESCMLNRVLFVKGHKFKKPIHLLGNNLPVEIFLLNECKSIRSLDSKLMARYGLNEMVFDINDKIKPKRKLYIENNLTKKQIEFAIKNINKLEKEVLKYGQKKS